MRKLLIAFAVLLAHLLSSCYVPSGNYVLKDHHVYRTETFEVAVHCKHGEAVVHESDGTMTFVCKGANHVH